MKICMCFRVHLQFCDNYVDQGRKENLRKIIKKNTASTMKVFVHNFREGSFQYFKSLALNWRENKNTLKSNKQIYL